MNRLHTDSIEKHYNGHQILTDICLTCHTGETVGILGRNGSGKSTLLKIISGSIPADYRYLSINEKVITSRLETTKHIAYLPQEHFLPGHLTIGKAFVAGISTNDFKEATSIPKISKALSLKPGELSGGNRRFIETVFTMYSPQHFILLDEPYKGLSPLLADELSELIIKRSKHKGFVITDHNYERVEQLSTRTLLLHQGSLKDVDNKAVLRQWGYLPHSSPTQQGHR